MLVEISYLCGGLSSACQFQYNPQNLMRGKQLIKHTYTIVLTFSEGSLKHLTPGEQGENTTSGTKSKSTERTLMMASDGKGWTFGPYSRSGCLFPMMY